MGTLYCLRFQRRDIALSQRSMGEGSRGPAGVLTAFLLGLRFGVNAAATNSFTAGYHTSRYILNTTPNP